jgi:hypothetical protein
MPEFSFDPPLTLKGNIVVRNLDEAVRFMVGYLPLNLFRWIKTRRWSRPIFAQQKHN